MTKKAKRILTLLLALMLIGSGTIIEASASQTKHDYFTVTGIVTSSYGSPCDVYTNGSSAKLRICTFTQSGKRTSGKIKVKAVSDAGAIYTWNVSGCNGPSENSTNITLPSGNTHYKIYIRRNGNSNSNRTNTYYVSIDFKKNCWH